ncbi:MAG: 4-hydroxy-tetrahydrodipicolinate synthase [Dysgonamonadaceae bacterium]|jgi:4-hydroxy-tetrahydrodipicolinate synthase|nr:4-hydroxy-tetrahydrodipicolinate synthase [Dysgonamonadaceae bacterium]
MAHIHLQGLGVALITPFTRDGSVDYPALTRLTDDLLSNGVDYLVVLGTTGETATLSSDEQQAVVRTVVSQVNGRVPIVAGIGGNCTQTVVQKLAGGGFPGISAVLSVVPYYSKPTQEGIYRHYKQIAESSPAPLILYNVPSRTGVNMTAETTLRLSRECANIVAVKEASGNTEQIKRIIREKPAGFQVLSGDDMLAVELIIAGATGLISVIGNAFPRPFKQMVDFALSGDEARAQALHRQYAELLELIFADGNPAGIKNVLYQRGFIENVLRLPLVPVSVAIHEKIQKALSLLG